MLINKDNGKPVDVDKVFITNDPVVVLLYTLFIKYMPVGVVAGIVKNISDNKDKPFAIEDKELGEYAQKLTEMMF